MEDPKYVLVKREKISSEMMVHIFKRDGYRCRYCGSKKYPFHIDHVYPVSKGGETTMQNLVTACEKCNREKLAKTGVYPKPIGYFSKRESRLIVSTVVLISWNVLGLYLVFKTGIEINPLVLLLLSTIPYLIAFSAQIDYISTGKNS